MDFHWLKVLLRTNGRTDRCTLRGPRGPKMKTVEIYLSLPCGLNRLLCILNEDQMLDFTDCNSEKREVIVEIKMYKRGCVADVRMASVIRPNEL